LSLSHNKLTGTIPAALLDHDWSNLDLSYNAFMGALAPNAFSVSRPSAALSLDNNRLSGKLPGAFTELDEVNVLESNLFSCKADRSDLPANDPNEGKYDCASTTFDDALYAWMAILIAAACLVLISGTKWLLPLRKRIIEQLKVWNAAVGSDMVSTRLFAASVKRVVRVSATVAAYIVLFLLPIYAVCTALYGTYTHQYAYAISAAYLSGPVPFAWEFVFLLLLLAGFCSMTVTWTKEQGDAHSRQEDSQLTSHERRRSFAIYTLTALLNFVIVLGVNTAYVIIALNRNGLALTFTQIALALFKVAFNSLCSPALLRWTSQSFAGRQPSPASFITVQLLVSIVNNILVPCLVVSIVSPNCFYNIFKSAAKVETYFTYSGVCSTYTSFSELQFGCTQEASAVAKTSYNPPFEYSYQCSSSFITYYAPAYVIMCIIAGFALPVAQVVLQRLHSRASVGTRWFAVLDVVLPRILKPLPNESAHDGGVVTVVRNLYAPIFDASQHLITLLTYLALLLTFGAVFPPLAVCFAVTLLCLVLFAKFKVGRFLVNEREANLPGQLAIVEQECAGVGEPGILVRAVSMIAVSAGVFYTLFLFDTLGDQRGLSGAYWVLIVAPLVVPCSLTAVAVVVQRVQPGECGLEAGDTRGTEVELHDVPVETVSPLANANLVAPCDL
jgi:hypothetical protein